MSEHELAPENRANLQKLFEVYRAGTQYGIEPRDFWAERFAEVAAWGEEQERRADAAEAEVKRLRRFESLYKGCIDACPPGVDGPGVEGAILHMVEKLDEYRDEIKRVRALVEAQGGGNDRE